MIKHGEKTIMHFETWKSFWSHFQIIWQTLKENKQKTHYIKDIEALQWLANPNDELIVFSLGEKLANVTNITNNTSTSIILQHICFFFSLEIESLLISTVMVFGSRFTNKIPKLINYWCIFLLLTSASNPIFFFFIILHVNNVYAVNQLYDHCQHFNNWNMIRVFQWNPNQIVHNIYLLWVHLFWLHWGFSHNKYVSQLKIQNISHKGKQKI